MGTDHANKIYQGICFCHRGESRTSVLTVFENTHFLSCTCKSYITALGWGVGMLTFMLTCVTCTSDVTSLGWGGGDVNVHVNLRHMHI